jgi:DNA polymerase V
LLKILVMKLTSNNFKIAGPEPLTSVGAPFYSCDVAAGFPSPAADYAEEKIDFNKILAKTPAATFIVRVEGESMIEAFIPHKALLVVDRSIPASTSDIIVAVVNAEFTVKRLIKTSKGVFLVPANPMFKSIKITDDMDFKIWGVVVSIIINPKEL